MRREEKRREERKKKENQPKYDETNEIFDIKLFGYILMSKNIEFRYSLTKIHLNEIIRYLSY